MKKILALLLIAGFMGCSKPQGFEYRSIRNFKIDKLGFDKTSVSLELVYFNPNNFGVALKHIDCDVYVDHIFVGKYLLDTTMQIPKKAEFYIPSKMDVDMKNLYKNTLNAIFATDVLLELRGNTRVGKAGIFVNVPFNYSTRQKLDFF
ncbi:hypothetical protein QTN47_08010 [Danxiaibacter flavus]|uniref:Late embryogenesis abundant protein LEA-2 subgroup domain-containing protein n=1 Tax=Danxiaibacter flavus TaxID=3049108 RepID=A0ABV3ZC26_9BACT|nr:hypothetical protein QNM32_08010 [Chitinophagaceae bacterium DXS]